MNTEIPFKFRALAAIMHAIGGFTPIISLPITWILWITTKELHPFIDRCGRSALNFQSSVILYTTVAILVLGTTCGILSNVGSSGGSALAAISYLIIFGAPILYAVIVVIPIAAAILAILGKVYSYPLTIKFISEEQ